MNEPALEKRLSRPRGTAMVRPVGWITRRALELAGRRPALRHVLKRIVAAVPLANRLASRLLAEAQADMVAAARRPGTASQSGKESGDESGAATKGFADIARLHRSARSVIARYQLPGHGPAANRRRAG